MQDRRRMVRNRVYYGGRLAFNARSSTVSCIVRDYTDLGAKVEFEGAVLLPFSLEFAIERRGLECPARVAWCDRNAAGLAFADAQETSDIIPLDLARRLRASERANLRLKAHIDQLLTER
jgi:PilZ domain